MLDDVIDADDGRVLGGEGGSDGSVAEFDNLWLIGFLNLLQHLLNLSLQKWGVWECMLQNRWIGMNRTTSAPISVLRNDVDKDLLLRSGIQQ